VKSNLIAGGDIGNTTAIGFFKSDVKATSLIENIAGNKPWHATGRTTNVREQSQEHHIVVTQSACRRRNGWLLHAREQDAIESNTRSESKLRSKID
jgi:hypothetical protein